MRERGTVDFFLQHYIKTEQLFEVMMLVTQRCNLVCRHCNNRSESRAELGTRHWRRIMTEFAALGALQAVFTGGEPLLRPDLVPLLRHADRLGLALVMFSNGLLVDRAFIAAVRGLRWRDIALSVYATEARAHDRLTGVSGSWRRTTDALALFADAGLPVAVNCSELRGLPGAAAAVRDWAQARGYGFRSSAMLLTGLDGDKTPLRLRVARARLRMADEAPVVPPGPPPHWRRGCGCGEAGVLINAYGDLFPCAFFPLPLGNLACTPLAELWRRSPLLPVIRRGLDRIAVRLPCRCCRARCRCRHCFGQAFLEEGTCWQPSRASCRAAGIVQPG